MQVYSRSITSWRRLLTKRGYSMRFKNCMGIALLLIITGCASTTPVVKRLKVPEGSEIAIIPFRDCTIDGQEDCYGSVNITGSIFARVFSTSDRFKAVPLSRPVAANEMLADDAVVDIARKKHFQFVLNGEVDEYYSVAPMTFRVDRVGVSLRILRVDDGSVAAFFNQRKEASTNLPLQMS